MTPETKSPSRNSDRFDRAAVMLAGLTVTAGILRIFLGDTIDERIGTTTLTYFGVAGALLMLKKIKSLSFGETKLEMRDLEEKADQAMELAKTAESMARNMPQTSVSQPGRGQLVGETTEIPPGDVPDDPWKGAFGGKAEANGRRLCADVQEVLNSDEYFLVYLAVERTNGPPLEGSVQFFIHNTFPNPKPIVPVRNGRAELRLTAWGAFTVGALADEGKTKLELDLSEDPEFPRIFRNR